MNDVITNYRIQEETILEKSKENDSLIIVQSEENKKSKFKKCLNLCLFLVKKASKIIPNSSIKLPFNFRGESSYSNWIMKVLSLAFLIGAGAIAINYLSKVGEFDGIETKYVKH